MAESASRPGLRRSARSLAFVHARRLLVVTYLLFLVAWPLYAVYDNTFESGLGSLQAIFEDPDTVHAIRLTLVVTFWSVLINTIFGVGISLLLVRHRFPGRRLLNVLVDLPLSVSPIVVGLALILVYGSRNGWFGPALDEVGLQIIFATPGMVMATVFVALPLVVREVVPVLEEVGMDQELAAHSLGANSWQTFRLITLPSIRWAVVYGVVLSLARSLGEFGAVKIVSGNVLGSTRTATLVVEEKYLNFDKEGAHAVAFLLAMVAVAAIVIVSIIRPAEGNDR